MQNTATLETVQHEITRLLAHRTDNLVVVDLGRYEVLLECEAELLADRRATSMAGRVNQMIPV